MDGIICLDKPEGITSFSAVSKLRRITGEKKAGHAGTLDPLATGVLPVMLGRATKFLDLFPDHNKEYVARIKLGLITDSLDISGKVIHREKSQIDESRLTSALGAFRGRIKQTPPMYSAVKKNGVKLYQLARQGETVQRDEREIIIHKLDLLEFDEKAQEFVIFVKCSKGAYIRSIADDVGKALGCGAALKTLRRTNALGIEIDKCYTFEEIANKKISDIIIPVEKLLNYPPLSVTKAQAVRFLNGGALDLDRLNTERLEGYLNVISPNGYFLGVGVIDTCKKQLAVKKTMPIENFSELL